MHRALIQVLGLGLCTAALAQTPEQQRQLEYERQQREYWRAQEQQQQEQRRQQERMQEDARRAKESWQSSNKAVAPRNAEADGTWRSTRPSTATTSGGAATTTPSGPDCATPVRSGDPNPLIGAWRFAGTAVPMRGVIAMMVPLEDESKCRHFLPESFEFTADAIIVGGSRRPVTYARQGATLMRVCVGQERRYFGVFEPAGGQEIRVAAGPPCRYQRVGGSRTAAAPQATTTPSTAPGLRFNRVYVCDGRRQVVESCGDATDDASCTVVYPDELRETRAGVFAMQRSERRGTLIERLKACSPG